MPPEIHLVGAATHTRESMKHANAKILIADDEKAITAGLGAILGDEGYGIEIAEDGIHIYNRDGHHIAQDAFDLYPKLGVDQDGAHAFYLGAELARAEIAWRLAKRYAQDEPLDWGVAADAPADDKTRLKEAGHTLIAKRKREAS